MVHIKTQHLHKQETVASMEKEDSLEMVYDGNLSRCNKEVRINSLEEVSVLYDCL